MKESRQISSIPSIRSHERIDFKRCPKKWYWKWRKGLTPRLVTFGPLEFGTWMHTAFESWYHVGTTRNGSLASLFAEAATTAINSAHDAGATELEKAHELAALGYAMATAYEERYLTDHLVDVIRAEIPLEFTFDDGAGNIIARHLLKPDLVFTDRRTGDVWLMEHKTAATIRTGHLEIDDQARPYGVLAELALRKIGAIRPAQRFRGIMYNFLRKSPPDHREHNALGQALNKDGSVSKKQAPPQFVRHPVRLTRAAKRATLERLRDEVIMLATFTEHIRDGSLYAERLPKTPHSSCERYCPFFPICVAEENGIDIREMQRSLYTVQNPYDYDVETTDVATSFEMG